MTYLGIVRGGYLSAYVTDYTQCMYDTAIQRLDTAINTMVAQLGGRD